MLCDDLLARPRSYSPPPSVALRVVKFQVPHPYSSLSRALSPWRPTSASKIIPPLSMHVCDTQSHPSCLSSGTSARTPAHRYTPQTWLATVRPGGTGDGAGGGGGGQIGPSPEGATANPAAPAAGREPQSRENPEGQGRGVTNGGSTPPRVSQSRVTAAARPRTTVFNGIRRAGGGRRGGGGGGGGRGKGPAPAGGQGRDGRAAGGEGQGKTLKELVMFDQILSQVWCGVIRGSWFVVRVDVTV